MFHKKELLPVLCVSFCLCCGGMIPTAYATQLPTPSQQEDVSPYMLYLQDWGCTLSITRQTAYTYASVTGQKDIVDRCRVVVYLQEKFGSIWKTVATWTDESDGGRASVSETKTVTAGKTYRAKAAVTAWSGGTSETKTILSSERKA